MGSVTITPNRLNVGSGQRPFKSPFINVDIQERWNPDVVADATHMPMFDDDSADLIVLHHCVEHEGCGEADGILRECRRILCSHGSLLVFVPHMRELAAMWIEGRISTQIYMTNVYGAFMGEEEDRHRWGYDFALLAQTLHSAGFDEGYIHPFDWRPIEGADLARARWVLAVEAVK